MFELHLKSWVFKNFCINFFKACDDQTEQKIQNATKKLKKIIRTETDKPNLNFAKPNSKSTEPNFNQFEPNLNLAKPNQNH